MQFDNNKTINKSFPWLAGVFDHSTSASRHLFATFHQSRGDKINTNPSDNPLVSVIVLQTREGDVVRQCHDSVESQSYPNIELVKIDNRLRKMTIGQGWNKGVKQSDGDYICLVGDDDFIHPDFVFSIMNHRLDENGRKYDHLYSWTMCVDDSTKFMAYLQLSSGPIILKDSLYKIGGFNERIRRYVDVEFLYRMQELGMTEVRIPLYYYAKRYTSNGHVAISQEVYDALTKHRDHYNKTGEERILKFENSGQVALEEARFHAELMMNDNISYLT